MLVLAASDLVNCSVALHEKEGLADGLCDCLGALLRICQVRADIGRGTQDKQLVLCVVVPNDIKSFHSAGSQLHE